MNKGEVKTRLAGTEAMAAYFCRRNLISVQIQDNLVPPRQKTKSPARIKPMPADMLPWFAQPSPKENMMAAANRPNTAKTMLKTIWPVVEILSREAGR